MFYREINRQRWEGDWGLLHNKQKSIQSELVLLEETIYTLLL